MNPKQQDTKERILLAAASQFAKQGFQGASIREIAKEADVNLAAVNYHFTNKQTLYWETFVRAHAWLEKSIDEIEVSGGVEGFAWAIFEHLSQHSDYLSNTFRTMLSSDVPPPEGEHLTFCQEKKIGPPGGEKLAEIIKAEVNAEVAEDRVFWAVRNIFTHILHWVMLVNSPYIQNVGNCTDMVSKKMLKQSLVVHVRATIKILTDDEAFK